MSRPRVSILLPTYRRPVLLARALRSAQAQTYRDVQIVVYDNASGDDTAAVVQSFSSGDPRVVYRANLTNIGALGNFRRAISEVDCEFFCLFSDDDILLPRCVELEVAGLDAHPQAMAWGGIVISANGARATAYKPYPDWPEGFMPAHSACLRLCRNSRPETTGLLFRQSVRGANFFPDWPNFMASDVNWLLQAAKAGGIGITNRPTAVFVQHAGSISTSAGRSVEQAYGIYWPSVRYLQILFAECNRLPQNIKVRCLKSLRRNFCIGPLRKFGLAALATGRTDLHVRITKVLSDDLDDQIGSERLRSLARLPRPLVKTIAHLVWLRGRLRGFWHIPGRALHCWRLSRFASTYLHLYGAGTLPIRIPNAIHR